MSKYTADFETTTDVNDCRVWAFATCNIENHNEFEYGNSMEAFMDWCKKHTGSDVYFHNLKFDGSFIVNYLLSNGYEWIKNRKELSTHSFNTLITDTGLWYIIEICFDTGGCITILDSLKILNFSVEKIAKDFKLPIEKLEIDYTAPREVGHTLTDEEVAYIRNDVSIMAMALNTMFGLGLTKMTIGSDALSEYKKTLTSFSRYFPSLDYDIDRLMRASYKGGWTYLNPIYKDVLVGKGITIDKNSMYPSHLYYDEFPIGTPVYYEGKYVNDRCYNLYIQCFSCEFKLKEGKLPSIQIKGNNRFIPNEYLESSDGDLVTLTLTNVDLELMFMQYDVYNITYHYGFKFKSMRGLFKKYIDKYMEMKEKASIDGNGAYRTTAKLLLNSLYGKFALNPNTRTKKPYLHDGVLKFEFNETEIRDTIYLPVGTYTTAYSRRDIILSAQAIRDYSLNKYGEDYFIYSDTDSITCKYMTDEEVKAIVPIHDTKLNHYKVETIFDKALFIRQKCYIKEIDGKVHTTIAGLPKGLKDKVNFENFKVGFSASGKLQPKQVKGGVVLLPTDFTIK